MPAEIPPDPGGDIVQDGPVDRGLAPSRPPLPPPGIPPCRRVKTAFPEAREGAPATAGAPERRELPPKPRSKSPKSGRDV